MPLPIRAAKMGEKVDFWIRSLKRNEISEHEFVILVGSFCDGIESLKRSALTHAGKWLTAKRLVECLFEGKLPSPEGFSKSFPCWDDRKEYHRREWEVVEAREALEEAGEELRAPNVTLCATFKLVKDPTRGSDVAALMMCAAESSRKFLFRRLRDDKQRSFVKETLKMAPKLVCLDAKEMERAAAMSYGARGLKATHKMPDSAMAIRTRLPHIAKKAKLGYCRAHKPSPLFESEDVDENVVWHMALELELIRRVALK